MTAAFAIGAAVLSGALATSTYAVVHHYLLNEQEARATTATYSDAGAMRRAIGLPGDQRGRGAFIAHRGPAHRGSFVPARRMVFLVGLGR